MADLVITPADVRPVSGDYEEKYTGPAGEAIDAGQYVRIDPTTGKLVLGNGTAAGEARRGGIALRSVRAGDALTIVRQGVVSVGDALDALDYDDDVFLSDTDGALADAAGTVSLVVGQVIAAWGFTTADKVLRVSLP